MNTSRDMFAKTGNPPDALPPIVVVEGAAICDEVIRPLLRLSASEVSKQVAADSCLNKARTLTSHGAAIDRRHEPPN